MIAQGGISKATKKLNVSEDIFAGMDATLRGRSIVHREFYQVRMAMPHSASAPISKGTEA